MPDYAAPITGTFVKVDSKTQKNQKEPVAPIMQLVARVFCSRNEAHMNHWNTQSYAQHMALEGFYEDVLGPIDDLVEDYQAAFGLIGKKLEEDEESEDKDMEILARLQDDVRWINANRTKISKGISALENIIDELSMVYLKAIYKLENLH